MTTNTRENILARFVGHGGIEPHNSVRQPLMTHQQIESALCIILQEEAER